MKIDDLNLEIIRHLREGRKPFKVVADALSVTENTVRSRVSRLQADGILEIAGLVDPEVVDGLQLVLVGVKLSTTDLVSRGREFSELKGVVAVSVVTGRYDLFLTVLLKDDFGLLRFYEDEVSKISDVQSVETFVVYKSYNQKVPYVL